MDVILKISSDVNTAAAPKMLVIVRIYCLLTAVFALVDHGYDKLLGNEAKLEDYPFLVLLMVTETREDEVYSIYTVFPCGGSCIKPDWVLTSAICLQIDNYDLGGYVTRDGVDVRMELRSGEPKVWKGVAPTKSIAVIGHPNLTATNTHIINTIGLVRLGRPITESPTVGTIALASTPTDYSRKVTIVGYSTFMWKLTDDEHSPPGYMKLRSLTLPVWPKDKCVEKTHAGKQVCYGKLAKNIWVYDLGGPVIYNKQLVGVTSANMYEICDYGLYEDVYAHKEWIESTIAYNMEDRMSSSIQRSKPNSDVFLFIYLIAYLKKIM